MTYDEAIRLHREQALPPWMLADAALVGLTLQNVHVRMGVRDVAEALTRIGSPISAFTSPASDPRARGRLVIRTWKRHPPGGWMRWPALWERVLALEQAVDDRSDVSADVSDPDPVVRMWAVVGCDARDDVPPIERLLADWDPEVALLSAAALLRRKLDSTRVRDRLIEILEMDAHWRDAARLLGPLHEPAAADGLMMRYRQGHEEVLEWLAYVEALPILEEELFGRASWSAAQAVIALGPRAATLAPKILAQISIYADEPPVRFDSVVPELGWWVLPHEREAGTLMSALQAIGPVEDGAANTVTRWATRAAVRTHGYFERQAAEVSCSWTQAGRREVAKLLSHPDEAIQVRALEGLAAAGTDSLPWRDEIAAMLEHPSNEIAFSAAVALAAMGDTRAARDAWLSFEAWPLTHHGTPVVLHRLSQLLIRDLPTLGEAATDAEDFRNTRLALETLGPERPDSLRIIVVEGDPLDEQRARAAETLRRWRDLEPE